MYQYRWIETKREIRELYRREGQSGRMEGYGKDKAEGRKDKGKDKAEGWKDKAGGIRAEGWEEGQEEKIKWNDERTMNGRAGAKKKGERGVGRNNKIGRFLSWILISDQNLPIFHYIGLPAKHTAVGFMGLSLSGMAV